MIEVINADIDTLNRKFEEVKAESTAVKVKEIDAISKNQILEILKDNEFQKLLRDLEQKELVREFSYDKLAFIDGVLEVIYTKINKVKQECEIKYFLRRGYILNKQKLQEKYVGKVKELHPNLNIDRLHELYLYPPQTLQTNYSKDEILIDDFVFRKYMLAIIQMIYNHMDLVVVFTGSEGSGKSTKCSQDMYLVWWILTEIGVIDYKFNIKDIFFNALHKLRAAEDKYFGQPYRILGLDEGNELNRQNWKDDEVSMFFQRLRRERFEKRIKFICIPVVGEMITNIVLSRVNFIFEMKMANQLKSGTLNKGVVDFFIIPRSESIYSHKYKKELSQHYIKTMLQDNLKDKSYLKGMPRELLIKRFKANGVWGFPEKEYIKELKETNDTFTINKQMSLTEHESYCLYRSGLSMKRAGINVKQFEYHPINKFLARVRKFWENNMDLLAKYDEKKKMREMTNETE